MLILSTMPNFKHDFIPVLDQLNRMFMAMSRKFVSQLIIFSYKGYFEIVLGFWVVFFFCNLRIFQLVIMILL